MRFKLKQGKLIARMLPTLVWVMALGAVVVLFQFQSMRVELKGIAFSEEQSINSVETGYIRSIEVRLYQEVKKGDTLAVIKENTLARQVYEDALLKAQKATAEVELEQLKAELEAVEDQLIREEQEYANDVVTMERRLAVDIERTRLAVLEVNATLEPDRLALKDLEVEIEIVKNLLKENAAEAYELQKAEAQYAILEKKIDASQALLAQAQQDYEAAMLRKDEFEQEVPRRPQLADKRLAPIKKAILAQEKRIAEFIEQSDIIVLTAPFDGIINTLTYKPGQTVVRGEPIMTIVKPTPDVITAWVDQKDMDKFDVNTKVQVASLNSPYETFTSQISDVGASIELIPERLWQDPTRPEWGRSVQITIQPGFACIHNEVLGIRTLMQ